MKNQMQQLNSQNVVWHETNLMHSSGYTLGKVGGLRAKVGSCSLNIGLMVYMLKDLTLARKIYNETVALEPFNHCM